jgi:hypothetical protein
MQRKLPAADRTGNANRGLGGYPAAATPEPTCTLTDNFGVSRTPKSQAIAPRTRCYAYRRINHSLVPYFACAIVLARSRRLEERSLRSKRSQRMREKSLMNPGGNFAFWMLP